MFLQLTSGVGIRDRQPTAVIAGREAAAILLLIAFAGELILGAFGISIEAFLGAWRPSCALDCARYAGSYR